ncbi:MAG: Sucraseferredoxin family protein [uncultured Corynebacteriales bacterium]|uniref:Sucraseferredoxin family protein n=1 Tax=uncultured Mycobacteriales bacterium TaxID=581187 RepID=A0A6J4JIM8_9ACTN|nr:MAG: Sucraseferredoxin family protein [uncultured Corynebacteriales bacterium]
MNTPDPPGPGAPPGPAGDLRWREPLARLGGGASRIAERCAASSENRGEHFYGSASPVPRWFLVEQPGGWGPEALLESALDPAVGARLLARGAATGTRVLLIRRPGRRSAPATRSWAVVDSRPGHERVGWGTWTDPAELLDVPLDTPTGTPGGPLYLVCAHGRHDTCCAIRGRPVAEALEALRPGSAWECSHVGGDRFAANVIALPHGLYYARVSAAAAPAVAAAYERGEVRPDLLRGRSAFAAPAQAAQHHARLALGETGLDALRPLGMARLAERDWRVRLAGPNGALLVTVRSGVGAPVRLTCSSTRAELPRTWELVAMEPA